MRVCLIYTIHKQYDATEKHYNRITILHAKLNAFAKINLQLPYGGSSHYVRAKISLLKSIKLITFLSINILDSDLSCEQY